MSTFEFVQRERCPVCSSASFSDVATLSRYSIIKCKECSLWCLNPHITNKTQQAIFSDVEMFKDVAPHIYPYYKDVPTSVGDEQVRIFSQLKDFISSGRLLDLGCGAGHFSVYASKNGFQVDGVDFALPKELPQHDQRTVFRASDFENEKLPERTYDVVTMFDVLEHCYHPHQVLSNIRQSLKPGGILVIAVPNSKSFLQYMASSLYHLSLKKVTKPLEDIFLMDHPVVFNLDALSGLLKSNQYTIRYSGQSSTDLKRFEFSALKKWGIKGVFWMGKKLQLENRLHVFAQPSS
jgi:2-polyprenyl-3-methyl-5-hydroxy-6-metoxy-1,4-benzoquinol methylase